MRPFQWQEFVYRFSRECKELTAAERAAFLTFIICKAKVMQDLVVLTNKKLASIDSATSAETARDKLYEIFNSREYLDLRSRCERLDLLTELPIYMDVSAAFGRFPNDLNRTLADALESLEREVEYTVADRGNIAASFKHGRLGRDIEVAESGIAASAEDLARRLASKWDVPLLSGDQVSEVVAHYQQPTNGTWLVRRRVQDQINKIMQSAARAEAKARFRTGGIMGLTSDTGVANEVLRKSPWFSGAFYLTVFISAISILSVAQNYVSGWAFPLIVIGGTVGTVLIGALQLRNDGRLSEKNFLSLVRLSLGRLGLMAQFWKGRPK